MSSLSLQALASLLQQPWLCKYISGDLCLQAPAAALEHISSCRDHPCRDCSPMPRCRPYGAGHGAVKQQQGSMRRGMELLSVGLGQSRKG